jgi:hypothetical protein
MPVEALTSAKHRKMQIAQTKAIINKPTPTPSTRAILADKRLVSRKMQQVNWSNFSPYDSERDSGHRLQVETASMDSIFERAPKRFTAMIAIGSLR